MADRVEAPDSLDDFPTPPWATRALVQRIIINRSFGDMRSVWEPACGRGHMAEVLAEYFPRVYASDVHDYGGRYAVGSFVGEGPDVAKWPHKDGPNWIITNPPFRLAAAFAERALAEATVGVALLLRTQFLEGAERYRTLVARDPYWIVCPFVGRVPMVKGRWDPEASTATAYAWFVWGRPARPGCKIELKHILADCAKTLSFPDDVARFASEEVTA
jgi:hypothetical protein